MKSITLLTLLTGTLSFAHGQDSIGTMVMWGAHVTYPQNVTMTLGLVYGKIHSGKSLDQRRSNVRRNGFGSKNVLPSESHAGLLLRHRSRYSAAFSYFGRIGVQVVSTTKIV